MTPSLRSRTAASCIRNNGLKEKVKFEKESIEVPETMVMVNDSFGSDPNLLKSKKTEIKKKVFIVEEN
jgi:hypothetical protein